jgi:hypothetical protein
MVFVRHMTTEDAVWAAGLMETRRAEYERYSPVFWRPRHGIGQVHTQFLASQVASPDTIALCCEDGFAIATPVGTQYYVDDFAVLDNRWDDVGSTLLRAVWEEAERRSADALRVVTALLDRPKVTMMTEMGLGLWQQWWVKPVVPTSVGGANTGILQSSAYRVLRGTAPPVYDPGGSVGFLQHFDDASALSEAEIAAGKDGLVLLIAPLESPHELESVVSGLGYEVASQFYVGVPR